MKGTHLERLLRLLQAVYSPRHYYAIHVSAGSEPGFFEAVRASLDALGLVRVFLVMRRQLVSYKGVSRLLADMMSMRELLARGEWDFWVGLTFGEYPLQSDPALRRHLARDLNGNYIEVDPMEPNAKEPGPQHFKRKRVEEGFVDMGKRGLIALNQGGGRSTPEELFGVLFHAGPAFGAISRAFCEYLRDSNAAFELYTVHATSLFPDEHYVHSALMASPFARTLKKNHLRFWKWDWHGECKVSHDKVNKLYGSDYIRSALHPCFLIAEDLTKKWMTGDRFFGYKFDPAVDGSGLQKLDQHVVDTVGRDASLCGERLVAMKPAGWKKAPEKEARLRETLKAILKPAGVMRGVMDIVSQFKYPIFTRAPAGLG